PVAGRMAPGRVLPPRARQVPRRRAVRRGRGAAAVRARRGERHAHRPAAHRRRGQRRGPRRLGDQRGLAALPDRQRAALRALLPRRRARAARLLDDALMLLTLVVFSPLAGAALLALLPREEVRGIRRRVKEFFGFLVVLGAGMLGTLVALGMFLFFVFWEVILVPVYFLVGVWGGPRRIFAAVKFVLFTVAGSLLMLGAILYCAWR